VDGEVLAISNRESIEIDYCPKCRGVWLDRGELIERSADDRDRGRVRDPDRDRDRPETRKPKKKSSFLSQIMENLGE
jgi:Zn-finger nucleic acid-binding protein